MKKGLWLWGYVLDKIPGEVPFVPGKTYCSLETAADYLGAGNAVYMNSMHDLDSLNDDLFRHVAKYDEVLCALKHGEYVESAERIAEFAKGHKNIKGAILDDFLSANCDDKSRPEDIKQVYAALKRYDPELKLYLVRYTFQDQAQLIPYLDYFDGVNLWAWISTEDFWRAQCYYEVVKLKKLTGKKPVLLGLFLHNYGETWNTTEEPLSMELTQAQFKKGLELLRATAVQGCVVLQNGWFCRESHRPQIQWVKEYSDWFYGTTTWR